MTEQQFTHPSSFHVKWKVADEGQLRIQKWSQFPFDGAISYAMSAEDEKSATPTPGSRTGGPADQIIGEIEALFPNWRSYRDLVDCITCELHALRQMARERS